MSSSSWSPKKYNEIEEFYQKLYNGYPAASQPASRPRKVLFVRERGAMFDEILHCVSKDAQLAGSPELLEFLGTRSPGPTDLATQDSSVLDAKASQLGDSDEVFDFFEQQDEVQLPTLSLNNKDVEKSLEEEEEEEEEKEEVVVMDTLGIMPSKKPRQHLEVAMRPKPSPWLAIFDEEVDPDAGFFSSGKKVSSNPWRPLETNQDSLKLFDDNWGWTTEAAADPSYG